MTDIQWALIGAFRKMAARHFDAGRVTGLETVRGELLWHAAKADGEGQGGYARQLRAEAEAVQEMIEHLALEAVAVTHG